MRQFFIASQVLMRQEALCLIKVQLQAKEWLSRSLTMAVQQQEGPLFLLQLSGPFCFGVVLHKTLKKGDCYCKGRRDGKKGEFMLLYSEETGKISIIIFHFNNNFSLKVLLIYNYRSLFL